MSDDGRRHDRVGALQVRFDFAEAVVEFQKVVDGDAVAVDQQVLGRDAHQVLDDARFRLGQHHAVAAPVQLLTERVEALNDTENPKRSVLVRGVGNTAPGNAADVRRQWKSRPCRRASCR